MNSSRNWIVDLDYMIFIFSTWLYCSVAYGCC